MSYSPDPIYEDAVARGNRLLEEINTPPQLTSSSKWKDYSELERNGWVKIFSHKTSLTPLTGVQELSDQYGIDTSASSNDKIVWIYSTFSSQSPGGEYCQYFNPAGRVIFAISLRNPLAEGLGESVSALSHWSDVTYLQWANLTSTPRQLKRVVHCSVSNRQSLRIIDRVMAGQRGGNRSGLGFSQRKAFTEEDGDDFKALVGSPNGLGTAWMLAQHKGAEQLGWKRVERISLFSTAMRAMMIIEIGNHPMDRQVVDVEPEAAA